MKSNRFVSKIFAIVMIMALLSPSAPGGLAAAGGAHHAQRADFTADEQSIPAVLPGNAPTATIQVSPNSGYPTQVINAFGVASVSETQVRLAWVYGSLEQTITGAVIETTASSYSAQVSVPIDAPAGPAQVCATVTGSAGAAFTCVDFTITEPPAGSVVGLAPVSDTQAQEAGALNATFHLFNQAGQSVASAPVGADGSFYLSNVPAGNYRAAIEGQTSEPILFSTVSVLPGKEAVTRKLVMTPENTYLDGMPCYETAAHVTMVAGTPSHLNDFGIVEPDRFGWTYMRNVLGPKPTPKPSGSYDFGMYISGIPLTVSFTSFVQRDGNTQVDRVDYYTQIGKNTPVFVGSSNTKPYPVSMDVGQLPPGQAMLLAVPVVNGQALCTSRYTIQMVTDPMTNSKFQPGSSTVWDSTNKVYYFSGTIPNVLGLLPAKFDTPSLPLFGVFENRLSAGVIVQGFLSLDGRVAVMTMDAQLSARLMNNDVVNLWQDLTPGGKLLGQWLPPENVNRVAGMIPPYELASFRKDLTLFSGPIIAVPPWVVVRASISVGVAGELTFSGAVYPFQPAVELSLTPSIEAWLGFGLAVDVIFGIAGAEAKIAPGIGVELPLRINPDDERLVWFDDPCLSLYVRLIIEGRILFFTFGILDEVIVNEHIPSGCDATQLISLQSSMARNLESPAVLESPAIAVNPTGRMIMVYVEDAGGTTPAPRITVRFKAAGSETWGAPQALTDGSHSVSDPVVTFAGPAHTPIVSWTQNALDIGSATSLDLGEILNRQEIYASTWDGTTWATPTSLSNDLVGDGRPSIAGDIQGATLAWTRDTDGNLTTRSDQRIAVREWTPQPANSQGDWDSMQILSAGAGSGSNSQVSAARLYFEDPATGQTLNRKILVWTYDADGDWNTNNDRRMAVAIPAAGGWSASLTSEQTNRSDSPDVSLSMNNPDRAVVAFLVRGTDGDGLTDTGMLSNQARLWTAHYQFGDGSVVNLMPVSDENGAPVRAERPRLSSTNSGETLLAFRQFGEAGSSLGLGQISLSQQASNSDSFSQSLMVTDEPRQNWQAVVAVDPSSNKLTIVKIGRPPILPEGVDATPLLEELASQQNGYFDWVGLDEIENGETTLDFVTIEPGADPAIKPGLDLSQRHAMVGQSVTVTATVRNLGRNASGEVYVNFFEGEPGNGVWIESVPVSLLEFNEVKEVSISVTASAGEQPYYAQLSTNGENLNPHNDLASADLGAIGTPVAQGVVISTLYQSALAVKWQVLELPGIAGYRVLRSTQPGGPFELVGETTQTVFNDVLLKSGKIYYYVIQAFDGSGVLSANSNEVSGSLPYQVIYAPGITR
jgi:hypothetical protein